MVRPPLVVGQDSLQLWEFGMAQNCVIYHQLGIKRKFRSWPVVDNGCASRNRWAASPVESRCVGHSSNREDSPGATEPAPSPFRGSVDLDCVGGCASISGSPRTWLNSNSVTDGFATGHVAIDVSLGLTSNCGSLGGKGLGLWWRLLVANFRWDKLTHLNFLPVISTWNAVIPRRPRV